VSTSCGQCRAASVRVHGNGSRANRRTRWVLGAPGCTTPAPRRAGTTEQADPTTCRRSFPPAAARLGGMWLTVAGLSACQRAPRRLQAGCNPRRPCSKRQEPGRAARRPRREAHAGPRREARAGPRPGREAWAASPATTGSG
jgi:hypothetical protein